MLLCLCEHPTLRVLALVAVGGINKWHGGDRGCWWWSRSFFGIILGSRSMSSFQKHLTHSWNLTPVEAPLGSRASSHVPSLGLPSRLGRRLAGERTGERRWRALAQPFTAPLGPLSDANGPLALMSLLNPRPLLSDGSTGIVSCLSLLITIKENTYFKSARASTREREGGGERTNS